MQIIIEIDNDYHIAVQSFLECFNSPVERILINTILNGKILPKGHGRLIDADVLKEQMIKYGFHTVDMTVIEFIEDVLPTIIEADTESDAKE